MTDNRTTELLQELRDLTADVNPSEIIDHVSVTRRGWTFDAQWLDAWHAEFERIVQAIAATLGSGTLTAEQVREAVMSADRWEKPMGNTGMTNTHLIIRDDGWQAIADELNATLGSNEPPYDALLRCLENDWNISASWDGLRKFWCIELTEEGVKLRDAELNARAERTCEIESSYLNDFTSEHECWWEFDLSCGHHVIGDTMDGPNYCEVCGAKVVRA